jgi:thioesterase domain-containing protein/acyl carrier protein
MSSKKDVEAIYPLSPSQQGMLFETLSSPGSGIHIEQLIVTLHGDLNLRGFEQAWQRVVERHSLLRTGFVWKNQDQPLQFVLQRVEVTLEKQDWRGLSSSQQQEQLEAVLSADRSQGFNLTKPPLMRFALFQIGKDTYHFLWTQHHILMDGWCLPLILNEVLAFYKAFCTNRDLSLQPSRPFKDYIVWLKQQNLSQAETFWRKKLQSFTKPTPLGIEAESSSFYDQKERYGQQKAVLSASATAALQPLVKQHHLTLNNLLQGVWALLLNRYSGEEDVVFGTTVSGRPPDLAGAESMIGLFINTLPIRIKVSPEAFLWTWLKNIQSQHFEQQAYEYCSAGQVHQWSEVRSSLPLFESILVFENYPDDSSIGQSSGLTIDLHNVFSKGAQTKYTLTLMVIPSSTLEFKIIYDSYRLASLDITLILEHFLALLNSIVAVPDQQIKTLLGTIHSDHIPKVKSLQKRNQQELEETFLAPRDALELQLTQIWQDVLKVHSVGVRDNFFELGGHSLVAITLMERIQQKFGKNLPLATLFQGATIEHLASILRQQTDSPSWSTLVAIQPEGPKRPLFCVHAGATTVLAYIDLASYLGSEQPFYGLESLGLDEEQKPYARIEDMAAHYIAAIQSVQPQGPYHLAGWCFGGLVAFEMAQQLQARGEQVSFLGLLDASTGLNVLFEEYQELDDAAFLVKLVAEEVSLSLDHIRQLEPDEQLLYVIEQARQLNLIPPDLELAQARRLVQMLKSHIYAGKIYIPQPYRGRVTLFRASEEAADSEDLTLGWQELATEGVDLHWVPGNHLTMVREPHVQVLARQLRACLYRSQAND